MERKWPDTAPQRQGLTSFVEWLFFHPKQGVFQQNLHCAIPSRLNKAKGLV